MTFKSWLIEMGAPSLTRKLKVSRMTVYNWKNGKSYPEVTQMKRIKKLAKGVVTYEMMIDRVKG